MISDYTKYEMCMQEKVRCYIVCIIVFMSISILFFDSKLLGLTVLPLSYFLMPLFSKVKCERRLKKLKEEFVDLLYSLSSSFATGMPMSEAMREAKESLALTWKAESLIAKELELMIEKMNSSNESEKDLLYDFASRSGLDDLKSFVESYYICRDSGGDLVGTVNRSAQVITDKLLIEKDMKTLISQKIFEGRIIAALPPFIILFLRLTAPDYLKPLYEGTAGRIVMLGALISMAFAFYYSGKLSKVVFAQTVESCLPEFMSRMSLLLNSGMVLQTVFERMANETKVSENILMKDFKLIYKEAEIEKVPLITKFREYARKSGSRELLRFTGILSANIDKGTELTEKLEREAEFMWHSSKKQIEEKSKLAETKMAFPMSMMLVTLILITISPAMMTLS